MDSKGAALSFRLMLTILSASVAVFLSLSFVHAAHATTCPGALVETHTCSASYTGYEYSKAQQSKTLEVYQSCDISEEDYEAIGPMPGKVRPEPVYSGDCPECYTQTHTYAGHTWHCSRVVNDYEYDYFHHKFSIKYFTSCTISDSEKQALINQGYAYDHRERTYDGSIGEWTDVHYMVKCPAQKVEQPKKGIGEECGSSSECESDLTCDDDSGECRIPLGDSCSSATQCEKYPLTSCDETSGECRFKANVECSSDSQCRSELKCLTGFDGKKRCLAPVTSAITSAAFVDLTGAPINSADSNDTVMLIAQGTGLNGKNVTFKAYKKQILLDSKVLEVSVFPSSPTTSNMTFRPTSGGIYYFKASVSGSETKSSDLIVGNIEVNTPPIVTISGPAAGSIYFVGSNITFTHSSYDPDDSLSGEVWNFGDGMTGTGKSTTHSYSTPGQKNVVVEVTDGRGAKTKGSTSIAIANQTGYSLFVNVEKPAYGSVISNASLMVEYSARQTYVINVAVSGTSACTATVSCVQGQCPSSTSASPSCAANKNAAVPVTGAPQAYSQLAFNWSFKDGMNYLMPEQGTGKVSGSKGFSDYGQKNITLNVKFTSSGANPTTISSSVSREFLLLNQRQCSISGTTWYKIDNGFITETRDTLGTVACTGLDLQAGTNDDCCPLGFTCSTGLNPGCKLDNNATLGCSSYVSADACTADAADRVRQEVLWQHYNCGNSVGGNNILCSCEWNEQNSLCEFARNTRLDNGVTGALSSCTYTTQTGQCSNGYQTVEITASSNIGSDELCVGSTQTLPCARPVIELPFFSGWQIISSIVAVLLIYTIFSRFVSRK